MLQARGESPAIDEYHVKAAFLFNFTRFVEWPADAFTSANQPFQICVMGKDSLSASLEDAVQGKTVGNRSLAVRNVSSSQQAAACHIVFIAASERKRLRPLLADLGFRSVLTVGESDDFTEAGGIINFKLRDARIRIEINSAAADQARLRISSKLLTLADSKGGGPHAH